MNNMVWHPASEKPKEFSGDLLLYARVPLYNIDGDLMQGVTGTDYYLGCYANGKFWDEIGERLPDGVTVTHWMRIDAPEE